MAGNHHSGRRPQPTALRILKGTVRRRQTIDASQIAPAGEAFDVVPQELVGDALAAAEWARVAPLLRQARMISEAERTLLIALCQQWSLYLQATATIQQDGPLAPGRDGTPRPTPYVRMADTALRHCERFWADLGLSPNSRARSLAPPGAGAERTGKWAGLL